MRYWWVNQNQTFEHETRGGYLWSPQRKTNHQRNPFYEFMREVAPGDIVFSFQGTYIRAIGVAASLCYACPKPAEFGAAGPNWSNVGWKIDVRYSLLENPIRPADHMAVLQPLLPAKYFPLKRNGHGLQNIYLTSLEPLFANVLMDLIGHEARRITRQLIGRDEGLDQLRSPGQGQAEWEEHLINEVRKKPIAETEKSALILARRGQGVFKQQVRKLEKHCRITKVDRIEHLRASHCKPWRHSDDSERLDGENGLLLTPTIDHLFDSGVISFERNGDLLVSPVAHRPSLERMGIQTGERINVGPFSEGQRKYLDFHRDSVFLQARVSRK